MDEDNEAILIRTEGGADYGSVKLVVHDVDNDDVMAIKSKADDEPVPKNKNIEGAP